MENYRSTEIKWHNNLVTKLCSTLINYKIKYLREKGFIPEAVDEFQECINIFTLFN